MRGGTINEKIRVLGWTHIYIYIYISSINILEDLGPRASRGEVGGRTGFFGGCVAGSFFGGFGAVFGAKSSPIGSVKGLLGGPKMGFNSVFFLAPIL